MQLFGLSNVLKNIHFELISYIYYLILGFKIRCLNLKNELSAIYVGLLLFPGIDYLPVFFHIDYDPSLCIGFIKSIVQFTIG